MTILINNAEITHLHQLPDNIQSIVQLIPDAAIWLNTIIENQEQTVAFSNNAEFVENLAIGLRSSSFVYLSAANITADVEKLLAINANDLRDLVHIQNNSGLTASPANAAMLKTLEHKYRLINNDAFSKNSEFFTLYNLNVPHLIWPADFPQQIEFYQILNYCDRAFTSDPQLSAAAGMWAAQQAQNLAEFAHYYCMYVSLLHKNPQLSEADVDSIISQLRPYMANALDSPVVTFELDKYAFNQAITQWQEAGNILGFTTLTAALLGTILNMPTITSTEPVELAKQYLHRLQAQLKSSLPAYSYVNQAGTCRHYQLDLGDKDILLNVDHQGCLSISLDFPKPPATAKSDIPHDDAENAVAAKSPEVQTTKEQAPKAKTVTPTQTAKSATAAKTNRTQKTTTPKTRPTSSSLPQQSDGTVGSTTEKPDSSAKQNTDSDQEEAAGEDNAHATPAKKQPASRKRNPKST